MSIPFFCLSWLVQLDEGKDEGGGALGAPPSLSDISVVIQSCSEVSQKKTTRSIRKTTALLFPAVFLLLFLRRMKRWLYERKKRLERVNKSFSSPYSGWGYSFFLLYTYLSEVYIHLRVGGSESCCCCEVSLLWEALVCDLLLSVNHSRGVLLFFSLSTSCSPSSWTGGFGCFSLLMLLCEDWTDHKPYHEASSATLFLFTFSQPGESAVSIFWIIICTCAPLEQVLFLSAVSSLFASIEGRHIRTEAVSHRVFPGVCVCFVFWIDSFLLFFLPHYSPCLFWLSNMPVCSPSPTALKDIPRYICISGYLCLYVCTYIYASLCTYV